jgi:hypothetical protein
LQDIAPSSIRSASRNDSGRLCVDKEGFQISSSQQVQLFVGETFTRNELDHSPSSRAGVMITWSSTSTPYPHIKAALSYEIRSYQAMPL